MKRTPSQSIMILLPPWIPEQTWEAYLEMRKVIKKPLTEYAQCLAIEQLVKLREEGEDPIAVLNQSIFQSWAGLFAVKESHGKEATENSTDRILRRLHEQDAR